MTRAPMINKKVIVDNASGNGSTIGENTSDYYRGFINAGTHRIERIGGEQSAGERKVVQLACAAFPDGDCDVRAVCDDGTMWMLDYRKPEKWDQLPPIPQPTPSEPAQDSELARELKALRDRIVNEFDLSADSIGHEICEILDRHAP